MSNRTDSFDRADNASVIGTPSDAGSAWTTPVVGTWGINTNRAYTSASDAGGNDIVSLESSLADVDVQVTLPVLHGTAADLGICARIADTSNFLLWIYTLGGGVNGLRMFKKVAGSFTQLGSTVSYTASANDVLKLTMNSSTLNGYVNGTLKVGPQTDGAGSTNTKHGLRLNLDTTSRFDDFSITDNTAASTTRGTPFGHRGTAFNGGRTFHGIIQ